MAFAKTLFFHQSLQIGMSLSPKSLDVQVWWLVLLFLCSWKNFEIIACVHIDLPDLSFPQHQLNKSLADAITMATEPARDNWIRGYFKSSTTTTTTVITWPKNWEANQSLEVAGGGGEDVWQCFTLDLRWTFRVWNNSSATTIKTWPSCEYLWQTFC